MRVNTECYWANKGGTKSDLRVRVRNGRQQESKEEKAQAALVR